MRRLLFLVAGAVLVGAAGTAIGWVAIGSFGDTEARIVLSLLGIFLPLASAVAALRLIERRRLRLVGWLALAAVPVELAAFVDASWYGYLDEANKDAKWYPTALAWVLAALVVTTMANLLRDTRVLWALFPLTFLLASIGASIATVMIWGQVDNQSWGRPLACVAIATAAGWLLGPITDRILAPPIQTKTPVGV